MTRREILKKGTARLKARGVESPGLDAGLLLGKVLGTDRTGLLVRETEPVSEEARREYEALLEQRATGVCAAYLLGKKEFWGLDFWVTPAVLTPRPDTETLVSVALAYIDALPDSEKCPLLDLCTGSGAVGIAIKYERPRIEAYLADISPSALAVAAENARRLIAGDAFCLESDLFDRIEGKFRLITANPPYIPQDEIAFLSREVQGEPRLALDGGADGLGVIRRLIAGAPGHLLPGGRLFIEADPRQMSLIRELLGAYRDLRTYPDLAGNPRVIAASLP